MDSQRPESGQALMSRAHLLALGHSPAGLTSAVREGRLIRVRRGIYAAPGTPHSVVAAVRVGGRLACTSALATAGIWTRDDRIVHIHLDRGASRPRGPQDRFVPLTASNRAGIELHWRPLSEPDAAGQYSVGIVDAMIQAVLCQHEWDAIASLDSALYSGALTDTQLDAVFFHLPPRSRRLRQRVDGRSESGLESIFRLLLVDAGIPFEIQVPLNGVGRVDFVIAGHIVVETDGVGFHGGEVSDRDYDRDLALVLLGYLVVRFRYRHVMYEQERVIAVIRAAMSTHSAIAFS